MEYHINLFKHIEFTQVIPDGFSLGFHSSVFHTSEHLALQGPVQVRYFIIHHKKKLVKGQIFFHVIEESAFSPLKASFGGVEISRDLDLQILFDFIKYSEEQLVEKGIKFITVTPFPAVLNINVFTKTQEALLKNGFQIASSEISAILEVKNNFLDNVHNDYKRRTKHLQQQDIVFNELTINDLEEIYLFILSCRQNQGKDLSMSLDQLKSVVDALPQHFKFFALLDKGEIVAASISIKTYKNVLYNFYSSHHPGYDRFNPVVMLLGEIYEYCKKNKIEYLDLGTSAIGEDPNFSLLHFKEHLGAVLSPKLTFTKKII